MHTSILPGKLMTDNTKHIKEWQEKVKHTFDDETNLHHYLIHTMDNFLYRYLETSESQNLSTQQLAEKIFGCVSYESNMVSALKIGHPSIKPKLINFAKSVPKSQGPRIQYSILVNLKDFKSQVGEILITTQVSWDFPHFENKDNNFTKNISFKYEDLTQFRKELALKLEDACSIFL